MPMQFTNITSHRDDWSVWNGYLQACIGTGKTFEIAPLLAEAVAEGVRPAKLALIGLHLHAESQDEASNFTNTLDAMQAYFDAYQDQTFCFTDIRDFVVQLPTTAQADLRRRIEQSVRSIKAEQDALLSKVSAIRFFSIVLYGLTVSACVGICVEPWTEQRLSSTKTTCVTKSSFTLCTPLFLAPGE